MKKVMGCGGCGAPCCASAAEPSQNGRTDAKAITLISSLPETLAFAASLAIGHRGLKTRRNWISQSADFPVVLLDRLSCGAKGAACGRCRYNKIMGRYVSFRHDMIPAGMHVAPS
jgi:hypothetical protein